MIRELRGLLADWLLIRALSLDPERFLDPTRKTRVKVPDKHKSFLEAYRENGRC